MQLFYCTSNRAAPGAAGVRTQVEVMSCGTYVCLYVCVCEQVYSLLRMCIDMYYIWDLCVLLCVYVCLFVWDVIHARVCAQMCVTQAGAGKG